MPRVLTAYIHRSTSLKPFNNNNKIEINNSQIRACLHVKTCTRANSFRQNTVQKDEQTLNYKYLVRFQVNKGKKKTCLTDMVGYGKEIGDHGRNTTLFLVFPQRQF